jgi:XTP/dITP diphosphohydrolase
MKKLLIATNNQGKVAEIKQIFKGIYDEVYSLKDLNIKLETIEDGQTFLENAKKKATEGFAACDMDTLADDSGLCVDALDGRPGIYSSRFAGQNATDHDNNMLLVKEMEDLPFKKRTGRFVCSLCLIRKEKPELNSKGEVEGILIEEGRGKNGFGYDPFFYVEEYNKTMGELSSEIKNEISHRAKALEMLKKKIVDENIV